MADDLNKLAYATTLPSNRNAWIVAILGGAAAGHLSLLIGDMAWLCIAVVTSVLLSAVSASVVNTRRAFFGGIAVGCQVAYIWAWLLIHKGWPGMLDSDSAWILVLLALCVGVPGVFTAVSIAAIRSTRRVKI